MGKGERDEVLKLGETLSLVVELVEDPEASVSHV